MSLQHGEIPSVPEETRRIAQAAFPRGNICMRMRDELGAIYDDQLFCMRMRDELGAIYDDQLFAPLFLRPAGSPPRHPGAWR